MCDTTTTVTPARLDKYLSLLADRECRAILRALQESDSDTLSLDGLATRLPEVSHDRERTLIRLQHTQLPKLAEAGIIDYDSRSKTIRYFGHDELDALYAAVTPFEGASASSATGSDE